MIYAILENTPRHLFFTSPMRYNIFMETIIFTPNAADKVKSLIEEENDPTLKLRVFVEGGGCSGFRYGFKFDDEVYEEDTTVKTNNVTLVVDPMSYQYLLGASIDFEDNGIGGTQFVIKNPNATSTCGCGSSFAA